MIAAEIAEFVSRLRPEDLPPGTREIAKQCMLDLLAAAVAGYPTDAAATVRSLARELSPAGPAHLWFSGDRCLPPAAALANSAAASALDVDDGHGPAAGHPGASIIPAVLAVAEETGASGREVLAAIVIGYDVAIRVATARDVSKLETFAAGRWCAYGAAAAGGWLMRLSPGRLTEALAIAGVHAPDLAAAGYTTRQGHSVKEGIPWSTLTGLVAVRLAERGFTGPTDVFDHPAHFDARRLLDGLGESYAIEQVYFKPYSCCRWIHTALDAFLGLQAEHNLRPDGIAKVKVYTVGRVLRLGNSPAPWSFEAAQYSAPFCLAVAACEGRDALLPLTPELLGRPDLVAFGERVELEVDPTLDALFPRLAPARVVLETRRGTWERRVDHPLGDPENPMGLSRQRAKFHRLTDGRWPRRVQEEVTAAVRSLEEDGFARLAEILRRPLAGPKAGVSVMRAEERS